MLLALSAFSLSLLGTFLVRSGVLVSVHAFASDPTRGLFILGFLLAVIGSSLLLFAFKGSQVRSHGKHELWSRETLLLCNNIMLVAGLLTVLLGTLLPLVHKELGLGSISIGTPFFNHIYSWLIIPFALLLGVGPLFRWRRQELGELKGKVVLALVLSLAAAILLPLLLAEEFKPWAALGIGLGAWIIVTSVQETWVRATHKHSFAVGVRRLGNSHWAMILGHVGLAVSIIGIACTQNYSIEKDLRMQAGDRVQFADYEFVFTGIKEKNGPNYDGFKGVLEVHKDGKQVALLKPEKRMYKVTRMPMTEAAIDAGFTGISMRRSASSSTAAPGRCGSTTNPSYAGSGSAASSWPSAACWQCWTSATVSVAVTRRPRHEQEDLVVSDPLHRVSAGGRVSVQGALFRSHQARVRDGGQGSARVHPAGHLRPQ